MLVACSCAAPSPGLRESRGWLVAGLAMVILVAGLGVYGAALVVVLCHRDLPDSWQPRTIGVDLQAVQQSMLFEWAICLCMQAQHHSRSLSARWVWIYRDEVSLAEWVSLRKALKGIQ